jgi:hypothetical protein
VKFGPKRFTWSATVNGKTRSFSGQHTAGAGLLTLVSDNGPAIVGRITGADNSFNFRWPLLGPPAESVTWVDLCREGAPG